MFAEVKTILFFIGTFEVESHQFQIFWGSAPDHSEGAYSTPPDSLAEWQGACCPLSKRQEPYHLLLG